MILTCAKCGERKELCRSGTLEGIQQPRRCKECLIDCLSTGNEEIVDEYWVEQMIDIGRIARHEKTTTSNDKRA